MCRVRTCGCVKRTPQKEQRFSFSATITFMDSFCNGVGGIGDVSIKTRFSGDCFTDADFCPSGELSRTGRSLRFSDMGTWFGCSLGMGNCVLCDRYSTSDVTFCESYCVRAFWESFEEGSMSSIWAAFGAAHIHSVGERQSSRTLDTGSMMG